MSGRSIGSKGRATRHKITEVASQLFETHGFAATNVDRIAVEAKVNKATVYRYFTSKEDLAASALDLTNSQFFAFLSGNLVPGSSRDLYVIRKIFARFRQSRARFDGRYGGYLLFNLAHEVGPDNLVLERKILDLIEAMGDRVGGIVSGAAGEATHASIDVPRQKLAIVSTLIADCALERLTQDSYPAVA